MKMYSISYIIWEMQIKITMKYNYTPIRVANRTLSIPNDTGTLSIPNVGKGICWWESKTIQPL